MCKVISMDQWKRNKNKERLKNELMRCGLTKEMLTSDEEIDEYIDMLKETSKLFNDSVIETSKEMGYDVTSNEEGIVVKDGDNVVFSFDQGAMNEKCDEILEFLKEWKDE